MFISYLQSNHRFFKEIDTEDADRIYFILDKLTALHNLTGSCICNKITFNIKVPYSLPSYPEILKLTINDPRKVFYLPQYIRKRVDAVNVATNVINKMRSERFSTTQKLLHMYSKRENLCFESMKEVLSDYITNQADSKSFLNTGRILTLINNNPKWVIAYINPGLNKPEIRCNNCNTDARSDAPNEWNIFPTSNSIYIKRSNMLTAKEIPKCLDCGTNNYFIILGDI